ncbi:hypothetical protein [Corynebacterium hesseae]
MAESPAAHRSGLGSSFSPSSARGRSISSPPSPPAGFVFNTIPAVKGDSGGPALVDGAVIGTQALILNPLGRNLKLATLALVASYRKTIAAAATAMLDSVEGD